MYKISYLDLRIHTSREKQVCRFWEESNRRNTLGVSSPGMQQLLGNKALFDTWLAQQVDIQILGHMHIGPSEIVAFLLAVENGRF